MRSIRMIPARLIVALAVLGCTSVDKILEGKQESKARIFVAVASPDIIIARGAEAIVTATVTRTADYAGDVAVTVEELPRGVTSSITGSVTTALVTTVTLRLRADANADLGYFGLRIRGKADALPETTASLFVTVTVAPEYVLTLAAPSVTIVSGGTAPIAVRLARTNFSQGVTFSLDGAPGISAATISTPVVGDSAEVAVMVGPNVAPGTYLATLRGMTTGMTDRTIPLTVIVSADRLQLLAAPALTTTQLSSVTTPIVVNRNAHAGVVTLSAEGLPPGATATFQPASTTGTSATMAVIVGPSVAPGSYSVTIRASSAGSPDATTTTLLAVTAATIGVSINPVSVSLLQGTAATSAVTITRTGFSGVVNLSAEGVPAGLLVVPQPATVAGGTASLAIAASNAVDAGQYDISIRARPEGLSTSAIRSATLSVIVRAAPVGLGNVLLDWSTCTAPEWVAWKDGSGIWTQVVPVAGVARFNVASATGAYAFAHRDRSLTVRFMTQAELAARPIDMCEPTPTTKTITGTVEHTNLADQYFFQLGGGAGLSTGASPKFVISGVREGKHDLIGWGIVSGRGVRAMLRRDLDLPDGSSVDLISLLGPESFGASQRNISVAAVAGEAISHSMSYLTTPACVVNPLYGSAGGTTLVTYGIPDSAQRSTDYHLLTVNATVGQRTRTIRTVFHSLTGRVVSLPPAPILVGLRGVAGSYRRFEAELSTVPAAYNGNAVFEYQDGLKTMTVIATAGYSAATSVVLALPDFSGVSGWQDAYGMPLTSHGAWKITVDGASSAAPLCTENRTTFQTQFSGTY